MCIVVAANARIRMTELSLCDLRSGARLKEDCCVHVPEGVKARPRNLQCIAQGSQPLLNNLSRRRVWPSGLVYKKQSLFTFADNFPQHLREILRDRNRALGSHGLRRLNPTVPRSLSYVQNAAS